MQQSSLPPENSPVFSENRLKVTIEQFLNVQHSGLSLDHIYLLIYLSGNEPKTELLTGDKLECLTQFLTRRGLINTKLKITEAGKLILESFRFSKVIISPQRAVSVINNSAEINFDTWWRTYPSTDIFEHNGRKFNGNRGLKIKKDDCKKLYTDILKEGEYTADDLLRALKYEVQMKKEASCREGENKMKYMVNTRSYLYQRVFENFVEISKGATPPKSSGNSIDI